MRSRRTNRRRHRSDHRTIRNPYFCFKDIDENKAAGSIRIRIETIDYFLKRHREAVVKRREMERRIETELLDYERQLRNHAASGSQVCAAV